MHNPLKHPSHRTPRIPKPFTHPHKVFASQMLFYKNTRTTPPPASLPKQEEENPTENNKPYKRIAARRERKQLIPNSILIPPW